MPYILQERRKDILDSGLVDIDTPGELNFGISALCNEYARKHGMSYSTINDILGALTGATLEFNRRVVIPYEDVKIIENGDVYNGIEQQRSETNPT
jgi:hypothetical protein